MNTEELIVAIIIGAVVMMVLIGGSIIGMTVVIRPKILLRSRMKQIGMIGPANQPDTKAGSRRQKRIQDKIKQLEKQGEKKKGLEAIDEALLQAGIDVPLKIYFLVSACLAVIFTFIYLLLGFNPLGAIAVAIIGFFGVPKFILKRIAKSRQKKFTHHFADAIDLVVRGIRSGLPVNECFTIVAREYDPPLGEEFRLLVEGQKLGIDMDDLLAKGLRRLPTPEFKFFSIVVQIQKQTGGNLAETLANLSDVLRQRKRMRDKAKAMASEANASAAIIGSLPILVSLLLSVVNPEYLMLLFNTDTGNFLLGFGLFWMGLGITVMQKMINFEM